MLNFTLIFSAILPLMLCCDAEAAVTGSEDVLSYASYHSEWGEDLTPPIARSIHLELNKGKLNVSLTGNMPSLFYTGPVDSKTNKEIAGMILSMDANAWPGSTGDENKGSRRKDRCEWSVYWKGAGSQRKNVYGADTGKDTLRVEAEVRLCEYLRNRIPALYNSMPRQLDSLTIVNNLTNDFWSVVTDKGQVRVSVSAKGLPSSDFYVDPSILHELQAWLEKSKADTWYGFGYGDYEPGKMPLYFEAKYNTRQSIVVMAEPKYMPKGFDSFCTAVSDKLIELTRRWQEISAVAPRGIKSFSFNESGMRMAVYYTFYRRLEKEGVKTYILRSFGPNSTFEIPLNTTEEQEFAAILCGLTSWDGFKGNAKHVLDATSFTLNVEFGDGKKISASGYGKFPNGYREGKDAILNFITKRLPPNLDK